MISKEVRIVISSVSSATDTKKRALKDKVKELQRMGYNDERICNWLWNWKRRNK